MPISHEHATGLFNAGHGQACARETDLLDHYDRAQREEARLRQVQEWAGTARRWAGGPLVVDGVGVPLAAGPLLTG